MALVTLIFLAFFGLLLFFVNYIIYKKWKPLIVVSYLFALVFILLLGYILYGSIHNLEVTNNYAKLGQTGDYIGGLLNPFISVFAVIAAGFAFYAQYQANKQVQEQFKVQQFESQFYEMIHLHRENLNEMLIEGYKFNSYPNGKNNPAQVNSKVDKSTIGKKIFVTLLNEFEAIHLIATKVFKFKFNLLYSPQKDFDSRYIEQFIIDHSYYVFFSGISLYEKNIEKYINNDETDFLDLVLHDFVRELRNKRNLHMSSGIKEYHLYHITGSIFTNNIKAQSLRLSFNYKPFSGHQSLLAHYYRHLFQTVKFVVKQNERLISYETKRDYLRILRSMLSNHEQILLYYNWLAGFGSQWEEKDFKKRKKKEGNYFFTDYRMIHNIPEQMIIDNFKPSIIFVNEYLNFKYEKGRKENDTLFEIMGIKSKL